MVHALQQTGRILNPDGLLINVHDLPTPHVIAVHLAETASRAGWLMDSEDFENERAAFNALAQVVAESYFFLEDERDFGHNIYADDLNELQEWLADWWTTAILPDQIIRRLEALIREAGQPAKIALALRARMTKLRAA